MSIKSVMASHHLILCRPLPLLPSVFPSIRGFSEESVLPITWPKYWSFRFSISPFSEYSGLISFRIDWSDLLAVQGTLKSLLQHHSSKASILRRSAFLITADIYLLASCKLEKGNASKLIELHQAPHSHYAFWDSIGTRWVIPGHKTIDMNFEERQISKQIHSLLKT